MQVLLIGVAPLSYSAWQTLLLLSILFHHSNLELPIEIERRLSRFIVTPRRHGIHHSRIRDENNSNWSSGLTIWDRLHGTPRLSMPQSAISIGIPASPTPEDAVLPKILKMPFVRQNPAWLLPGDGALLRRETALAAEPGTLAE